MKQIYYVIQTLLRGRGSNIIKVISLGLGLTMSILLFSRVAYEQSFDTCFKDYDNLYQVWSIFSVKGEKFEPQEWNCGPVAGAILENFPKEVESAVSLSTSMVSAPLYNGSVRLDDRKIAADSLFFRTMGIDVLNGNPEKDLVQKDIIFLSERFARKVFGEENPIGKTLNYDHQFDLTVKGIYANLPENATINPEAVISMPTLWSRNWNNYSWSGGDSWVEFIRFRPGADKSVVNARIDAMIDKYRPAEDKKEYGYTAFVQPIRDTYRNYDDVQRMRVIMSILGFAILFIAALNYVLISISSLSYRAKSVGVHKCSGASGGTVFSMFLLETGIFSCRSSYFMREDFPALMGMTMKTGRMARDKEEVVVNETFAEMMRWGDDVVGRTVYTEGNTFKVVGQLKDFQIESFRTEKMPFIARGNKNFYGTVHVRLKEPFTENLQKLNHDVAEAFHDQTIDFTGYEKRIENSYNSVRVFRNATLMAAVTMFFIMLMGLIGYTTDEVRRRSKEIAIRKVNGAEASGILEMLSRDILVVAAPAVVIGTVLAWYVNGMWMEQFAERIHISWAVYVLVVMANLVIIVACVLWKSWRIANENPVNSIKSE